MFRRFVLSLAIVLLVCPGVFAGPIMQYQDFTANLNEAIDLIHGHSIGNSFKSVLVTNNQSATAPCPTTACQSQFAMLNQMASGVSNSAIIGIAANLSATGFQDQFIGQSVAPKVQIQGLGLVGIQGILKSDGQGSANVHHQAILRQSQTGTNSAGTMNESTTILAMQDSDIIGQPGATGIVLSTMSVTTTQTQTTF